MFACIYNSFATTLRCLPDLAQDLPELINSGPCNLLPGKLRARFISVQFH